jgi:hypothetical protein
VPPVIHQRLLNEATLQGTEEILRHMPASYAPELEQAIHRAVRQAVLHYAEGMDTLHRQLHPLAHGRQART